MLNYFNFQYWSTGLLILSGGLLFAPMAYGSLYYDPRRPYNLIQSSIFGSLRRFSWGLGCFVFMLVNCFGENGKSKNFKVSHYNI